MSVQALRIWVSIHHMIVFFLLYKIKMMTSPDGFFISLKFCFSGLLGRRVLKKQKMAQNYKKFYLTSYLRDCTSYDCGSWYTCVKWWYLQHMFSFFLKSVFSGFLKFINKRQEEILRCAPPSSHVCDSFGKLWLILAHLDLSRTKLPNGKYLSHSNVWECTPLANFSYKGKRFR